MIKVNALAEKIFGILKGNGFQIKLYSLDGQETIDPQIGRRFYVADPAIMVTIDEDNNELELTTSKTVDMDGIKLLQKHLKRLANEFLLNYTVRNYSKSIQPRDFSYKAKIHRDRQMESKLSEAALSKMTGSKKTSYQQLESVKILVKHKKEIAEETRGARSRNIHSIFLECNGERIKFAHPHLGGARAMARHMSFGGVPHDTVGTHITESTARFIKLNEFMRYTRVNKLINETSESVVSTIKENIAAIKSDLTRLTGTKSYMSISERIIASAEASEVIEEAPSDELRDMFTVKRFDEKFSDVLPMISQMIAERDTYLNKIDEAANGEIYISSNLTSLAPILEFKSANSELGYKLNEIANNLVENADLAKFITSTSKKLCNEQDLSAFEKDIIGKVLENIRVQPTTSEVETVTEIQESVKFERSFDKYMHIFM